MFAQRMSSFPARAMCLAVSTAGVGIAAAPPLIADWVPIAINAFIRLLLRPFLWRFMGSSLSACNEDWLSRKKLAPRVSSQHVNYQVKLAVFKCMRGSKQHSIWKWRRRPSLERPTSSWPHKRTQGEELPSLRNHLRHTG